MAKLEKSKLFEFWWQLDRRKLTRREAVDKCFEYFVSSTDLETSSLTNDNEDALKKSLDFTLKYYDKQYLAGSQKKSFVLKKISKLPLQQQFIEVTVHSEPHSTPSTANSIKF